MVKLYQYKFVGGSYMNIYFSFINNFITEIIKHHLDADIYSIYLGGSLSRDDYIIGISDIDIYFIVEKRNSEIEKHIEDIAKSLTSRYLNDLVSWCPDGVTISYTTYEDVISGTSWLGYGSEYFSFVKTANLLFGKDIKSLLIKPSVDTIKQTALSSLFALKEITSQEINCYNVDKYTIRGVFGTVFSASHFYLSYKGIYVRNKNSMVDKICELRLEELSKYIKNLYSLWNIFGKRDLTPEEKKALLNSGKNYISLLCELIIIAKP